MTVKEKRRPKRIRCKAVGKALTVGYSGEEITYLIPEDAKFIICPTCGKALKRSTIFWSLLEDHTIFEIIRYHKRERW